MQPGWWIKIRTDFIALVEDDCLLHQALAFLTKHARELPSDMQETLRSVEDGLYFTSDEEERAQLAAARYCYQRMKYDVANESIWRRREADPVRGFTYLR